MKMTKLLAALTAAFFAAGVYAADKPAEAAKPAASAAAKKDDKAAAKPTEKAAAKPAEKAASK
jgi:hypothetical protein